MSKDPRDIILRPVVSEKSYALLDGNVYTFVVAPSANKIEIRQAVEEIFNVKVLNVTTMNRQGKRKRNRRTNTVGHELLLGMVDPIIGWRLRNDGFRIKNEALNGTVNSQFLILNSYFPTSTIFPGFIRFSGSSARLIVRITSSAGPCSASRNFILP